MFSGIVEEKGIVKKVVKKRNLYVLTIKAKKVLRQTKIGDSISVDGICLTVTDRTNKTLSFDIMLETIRAIDPEATVYMCMESPRVWREVFGYDPGGRGLIEMLDRKAAAIRGGS